VCTTGPRNSFKKNKNLELYISLNENSCNEIALDLTLFVYGYYVFFTTKVFLCPRALIPYLSRTEYLTVD
jgi:hypothetical protein